MHSFTLRNIDKNSPVKIITNIDFWSLFFSFSFFKLLIKVLMSYLTNWKIYKVYIWNLCCHIWRTPRKSGLTPKTIELAIEWLHSEWFSLLYKYLGLNYSSLEASNYKSVKNHYRHMSRGWWIILQGIKYRFIKNCYRNLVILRVLIEFIFLTIKDT